MKFDPRKNAENIAKHGLAFESIEEIDWSTAVTAPDIRKDYAETRFMTYAMREGRLHCLIWTSREDELRPISFRKANARERKKYDQEKKYGQKPHRPTQTLN